MTETATLTPFLERALREAGRLFLPDLRCFRAQDLSRALWPDSPAWQRVSNNGPGGSTRGQGIKRAAGKPLARLRDLGLVRYCTSRHYGYTCGGYVVTSAGLHWLDEHGSDG